jgi:polyhydroxyalkanoate synthesis regulator phasin
LEELVDEIVAQGEDHLLEQDIAQWREDLCRRLEQVRQHPEQGLGFIEEHIRQATLRLQCLLVQKAMQDKANAVDEKCPDCQGRLSDKKRRVPRWIDAYCGKVKLVRTHGWCPHCQQWVFPADRVLGLREDSTASPLVQEMCALLVSKMPAEQAEALSLRVTGRRLSRSTLGREAQRQGDSALQVRQQLVAAPVWVAPPAQAKAAAAADQPVEPFTLVIQIDAWNIRERDHWGQTQKRRRQNQEVDRDRWHWVYTATCFRLNHRCTKGRFKNKLRALITERSYVATRGGVPALMQQLYYEARARGLAQAQRVLVIADGAVWIWNLVEDRFKNAVQRLDLYHANTYLWAVANELHGAGSPEARRWVKPLLRQIRNDQVAKVITQLEELQPRLAEAAAKAAAKAIEYYQNNQKRMKYKQARKRKEPVGSGAIESTCRQLQCRMKRCGQFWSTRGDEALLCLEMFWRNERWERLFPHAKLTAIANN